MRLLLNLILSLTNDETASLSKMRLRGKQKSVMQIILATRTSGREPIEAAISTLGLSASHLYQIISVLLDRCEKVLVPDGGIALLEFFACKNLHMLFKKELERQEKQLSDKEGKAAEEFYLAVFELLLGFSYNLVDRKLADEYARLYLASKKNPAPEDELAIKTRLLSIEMTALRADGKNPKQECEAILSVLQEYEKLARISSHTYFSFSVNSALAWYWRHLGAKPDISLRYMQRATPLAEKLEGFIFRDSMQEMQLRLADAHFNVGGAEEALKIFEKVYAYSNPRSMIWKRNSCLFSYLVILLYNGNYSKATHILTQYIQPPLTIHPTSASAAAASYSALLYLFTDEYAKALPYIHTGITLNTKGNFTFYNEIRIRYIETAYYYFIGDWSHAQVLSHRAVQYLSNRGAGPNHHNFGYYFKIIDASIELHSHKKPFSQKLEGKYKELTKPQEGLFGLLLKKIRAGR